MFQRNQDIYASAPLRRLLDAQTHVLMSGLQRCPGAYGLMLNACDEPLPRVYPGLACWATLRVCGRVYQGDLWAAADESLPFIDESFALVVLRHALEVVPFAPAVLAEAVRTLAPGGLLAVTGVHPVSGWTPWLCWRMRGKIPALQWPLQLRYQLRQAG
ncbi:MAG: class I SAM-dependent methyltransferase, partial [Rhodanobacter sp.]